MLAASFDRPNRFGPSRSAVMSMHGMVATSQPLASLTGIDILRKGGNAVDAAIAAAAMLNVIEPMSTGVGGDAFAIIYLAKTGELIGLNASGRSPYAATLDEYRSRLGSQEINEIPINSPLTWTVPGTVDGWALALERCGQMSLAQVLEPAIQTAENGFAVAPQTALTWRESRDSLAQHPDSARTWLMPNGQAPRTGEVHKNPNLARTFRIIVEGGRDAFYLGEIADQIVRFSESQDGLLAPADLSDHRSTWVEPISVNYRGYDVFELPPNGQGIVTLETLQILAKTDLTEMGHNTPATLHMQIEALKLTLCDGKHYVTDPEFADIPVKTLLSSEYAQKQRERISSTRALQDPTSSAALGGDTVYVCAADKEGNVVSFINSIFVPWGSGFTVGSTGVLLQNRGFSFSLNPEDINVLAPHKRTRHTIIPAMVMRESKPVIALGCVGGDMQPQGQVQFICNVLDFGMNLQDALDAPRWRYEGVGAQVALEAAMPAESWLDLPERGHDIVGSGGFFGGAQAILIDRGNGSFQGGSDSRRDGCAIGF